MNFGEIQTIGRKNDSGSCITLEIGLLPLNGQRSPGLAANFNDRIQLRANSSTLNFRDDFLIGCAFEPDSLLFRAGDQT